MTISPVTISHGNLSIKVKGKGGKGSKDEAHNLLEVDGASVGKLVEALNALGVKSADLTGILQAMHAAGALNGDWMKYCVVRMNYGFFSREILPKAKK